MKRLLLVGGGHSHVEVVRRWGKQPAADTAVTLLSPDRYAPYSGMLPGLVAGHYGFHDCHIDLAALCARCGVKFVAGRLAALDPADRTVACDDGTEQRFDVLSLDTGSTPAASVPGAREHAIPVKPVGTFLAAWSALQKAALADTAPLPIAVVGGGAGGVEMLLAMHHALRKVAGARRHPLDFALITDTPAILPSHPQRVQRIFERVLAEYGIAVLAGVRVARVGPESVQLGDGRELPAGFVAWITGAAAPEWARASGIATDERGFIAIDETLRSTSHPDVFAAGDVASMTSHPRPKSGVYAVRQGPPLTRNLRAALAGTPPVRYRPQRRALALISAGERYAVASYGAIALEGRWIWRWKDSIDRAFMARYSSHEASASRLR